jgi:ParB family transcriptional regulator, chromosome partitioning protein
MALGNNKKKLGLGIAALLGNIEEEVNNNRVEVVKELAGSVAMIPIESIETNPWQPRNEFDQQALDELSASIKIHGLIQPITVRRLSQNVYQLISGERRLRASKMAELVEIPAYVRIANDQEMLEMALVENIQRQELNPIEVAITYQRLLDECKLTHDKLSNRVGKERSTVTNSLRLLKLPPQVQQAIKDKKVSTGHAKILVGVDDISFQLVLFHQIVKEQLSVRQLEALVKSHSEARDKKKTPAPKMPDSYKMVQDTLSAFFGSKVGMKRAPNGKGQITIAFGSDEELNRILDQIEEKK